MNCLDFIFAGCCDCNCLQLVIMNYWLLQAGEIFVEIGRKRGEKLMNLMMTKSIETN